MTSLNRTICLALGLFTAYAAAPSTAPAAEPTGPIAPEVADLYNLIENGGFEDGEGFPAYWGRHPGQDNDGNLHERDTATAHSGTASSHIRWVDPIAGENKAPLQWSRYNIPVQGGIDLLVSGYVKTAGVEPAHVGANVYDAEGKYIGFSKVGLPKVAEDWTHFSGPLQLSPDVAKMGFVLYTRQGGDTWYDDVAVLGVPSAGALPGTPTLDGVLDEDRWEPRNALTTFVNHQGAGLAKHPVQAWIAYDDTHLYAAFHCALPQGAAPRAEVNERDGATWHDESIELFLDPANERKDYFHFVVNATGTVYDALGQDPAWNCGVKAATKHTGGAWTLEMAIPFADLDLGIDTGTVWGLNLARNDRAANETTTWSLGAFHNPRRFGNITLNPNLTPLLMPKLAEELKHLEDRGARLVKQFNAAGLTPDTAPEVFQELIQSRARIKEMAAMAGGQRSLGRDGAPSLRRWVVQAAERLSNIQKAAHEALYAIPETGDGGFRLAIATSLQKIPKKRPVPSGPMSDHVALTLAGDEAESFQLVLIPNGHPLKGVTVETAPLEGSGGALALEWHPVAYVETAKPRGYEAEYIGGWPDILVPPEPFDVAPDERQPIWFRVTAPPAATPGLYEGTVTVRCGDHARSIPVSAQVRSFSLPRPGTLPTAFGLYAHALSRWYHGNKPYRDAMPIESFHRWCEFMGKYRLTPKNIANEYIAKADDGQGTERLDLSALQQTIGDLYSPYYAPYSFCVYRLPCPKEVREGTTKQDPAVWVKSLQDRATEYQRLGLPQQAYVYGIDEPSPQAYPFVARVYEMARQAAPGFPIMQTVNHSEPEELIGLVDIWCPLSSRIPSPFYQERKAAGDTLWMYVCCSPKPPHANFFIDQPATDHRMVFWQARQMGATGLLYWCVCWWSGIPGPANEGPHFPEVPISLEKADTMVNLGTNGDGILIWPGPDMTPWPSIRLEAVRDGIEDYEYLAMLQRLVDQANALPESQRPAPQLLAEAQALCHVPETLSKSMTECTKDPELILQQRQRIGDMIERLM